MNISELITCLQEMQKSAGDIPVVIYTYENNQFYSLDRIELANETIHALKDGAWTNTTERQPVCVLWD
jgi:hypothetical protein